MAVEPQILTPSQAVANSVAVIYVSPANTTTVIKRAVFTNITAGNETITVHRVPNSGSPANANAVIWDYALSGGEAYVANELGNMVLNPGDSIQAEASNASSINVTMSGFTL